MNSYLSYYAYNYQGNVEEGFVTSLKALEIAEMQRGYTSLGPWRMSATGSPFFTKVFLQQQKSICSKELICVNGFNCILSLRSPIRL